MRYLAILLVLGAVAFGVAYFLNLGGIRGKVSEVAQDAGARLSGYPPAKTPQEAVDGFRKAIQKRDYEYAADVYCAGDFREQLNKAAKAGKELGKWIDNLRDAMKNHGYDSDKAVFLLRMLEPFPTDFEVPNITTSEGDKRATAKFVETLKLDPKVSNLEYQNPRQFDPLMFRALVPTKAVPSTFTVELRYEGPKADEMAWRIYFPVTDDVRLGADRLVAKHLTYCRALESVAHAVNHDRLPKSDFEDKLRSELSKCKD
jgi:hypothetical protein